MVIKFTNFFLNKDPQNKFYSLLNKAFFKVFYYFKNEDSI